MTDMIFNAYQIGFLDLANALSLGPVIPGFATVNLLSGNQDIRITDGPNDVILDEPGSDMDQMLTIGTASTAVTINTIQYITLTDEVTSTDYTFAAINPDATGPGTGGAITYLIPVQSNNDGTSSLISVGQPENNPVVPTGLDVGMQFTATFSDQQPTSVLICFAAGTLIATEAGETAVEALEPGDLVRTVTRDGGDALVPVKWIGRQTVVCAFGPAERLLPVRVQAGALGENMPHTDLTLTADHALLVDGLLINAGALVNGETVRFVPLSEMGSSYTVYHVELETHEIILANGTPAESFIDYVPRQGFDNYAGYERLYGADAPHIRELDLPRASAARLVPERIRARLAARIPALTPARSTGRVA